MCRLVTVFERLNQAIVNQTLSSADQLPSLSLGGVGCRVWHRVMEAESYLSSLPSLM